MINRWSKRKNKQVKSEIFFVRGFQRSGTNWVCNLLNLHPDISCIGEFHFSNLFKVAQSIKQRQYGLISNKSQIFTTQFETFIESTIKEYCGHQLFCGDRTPEPLNATIVNNKNYILIQRDGRDCTVSWAYHLLRMEHKLDQGMQSRKKIFQEDSNYFEENKKELLSNKFVKQLSIKWNNRILSDAETIKKVQNKELSINVLPIKYEQLLQDTDLYRDKMYSFIGTETTKAKSLNKKTKPGFEKVDTTSHYRSGKAGTWTEYFTDQQTEIFETEASQALDLLNYAKSRTVS